MRVRIVVGVVCLVAVATGARAQAPDSLGAPTVWFAGVVVDASTDLPLAGATVRWTGLAQGTATDADGRFRLAVSPDARTAVVSFVGYETQTVDAAPTPLRVALRRGAALGEVTVAAEAHGVGARPETEAAMGRVALSGRDVERLPTLFGEADVLKTLQLLPGVRGGGEATAGLYVRGGSPDQTLIRLDGTPVYNASHLFGFFSTFHPEAVDAVELTRGAYPARYGGRLGAVVDVSLRPGSLERVGVQGHVGLLAARLLAEGPVVPGRLSLLVAARRTHIDLLTRPFVEQSNRKAAERGEAQIRPRAGFYDLTARLHGRLSARDRLDATLYGGADAFSLQTSAPVQACGGGVCMPTGAADLYGGALDWGNRLGSVAWTRAWSPRAHSRLTLAASDYRFAVGVDVEEGVGGPAPTAARARYRSGIRDLAARLDVDLAPGGGHTVRAGASVTRHAFTPGALALVGTGAVERGDDEATLDATVSENRSSGLDLVAYAEDEWRVSRAWTVAYGLHGALYASGRFRYPSAEPRLSVAWRLHERLAVKGSAAVTQQPLHLLTTGAGVGLPADLWVPADSIGPQRGAQVALGLAGSLPGGRTTWSVEAYARRMRGLIAYRDGASFATPFTDWQRLVVTGDGAARGVEWFVQHRSDRATAWLSYTLARSDRRFPDLDGGAAFPYRYDRRHSVSAVALVDMLRWLDVSAAFVYGSGDAVTLPTAVYDATPLASGDVGTWVGSFPEAVDETAYGPRNGYRLPATMRLDLGVTVHVRRGPRPHRIGLTVYNATNYRSPFLTTFESRVDPTTGETRQQLVGLSLVPRLPAVSYQFAF